MKTKIMLLATACALLFFSCDTPYWEKAGGFSEITKEIELEDGIVYGNIMSIVKWGDSDKLYAGGGVIYSKNENAERGWSKDSSPPEGRVIRLAVGGGLYALTEFRRDSATTVYKVWYKNSASSGWTEVPVTGEIKTIFDNGEGAVYVNVGGTVKTLSGVTVMDGKPTTVDASYAAGAYFSAYPVCSGNGYIYEGRDSTIYHGSGTPSTAGPTVDNISSICFFNNVLYVGRQLGAVQIAVSGDGSSRSLGNPVSLPGSNADATLGSYRVSAIYASDKPSGLAVYAATVGVDSYQGSDRNCLWGYYKNRDNWNKE